MRRSILIFSAVLAVLSHPAIAAPPATPPPAATVDPQRLELGNQIAGVLWPNGSYSRMVNQMMGGDDGIIDMVLNMRPSDIVDEETLKKDGKLPPAARQTMREAMREKDPHFEERVRLTMKAMGEEMGRVFAPLEPKMRSGLGTALARRFDHAQLTDIAAFFSTASGKAYAEQSLLLFTDKALMTEMMSAMPEVMKSMPQVMERVKKATAHLPPAPKSEEKAEEAGEGEAEDVS